MNRFVRNGRPLAPEQEILLNRLVMGTVSCAALYFLAYNSFVTAAFGVYLTLNATLFAMRYKSIWREEWRWIAAIILDIGMAFSVMMRATETMSFFYPLLLWVILGNGFRYGVSYLVFASIMSVAAFGTVVMSTSYWEHNRLLGYSLTLGLIVIPAYCSTLIRKLSKAKDEAEAANRAKGYFLASVSHELRTPLNAIIGYGNHLRQMAMPKNQHDMVEASVLAGEHLLHLIDQLIQVAKSDSNAATVITRPLRITDLLTEIRDIMLVRAEDKAVALQIAAEPMSDQLVDGPADIIRNILLNLTGNAIKFTDSGAVSVNAGLRHGEDKAVLWFSVSDTGIGIAKEAIDKIFEPFQQADDTVMNRFGGTGLGLAICKQLVAQVGGTIRVDSVIGKGSTFTVEIPVIAIESDAGAQEVQGDQPVKILAFGMFEHELLAKAQNAGNYSVKSIICRSANELEKAASEIDLTDFDIAIIDDRVAQTFNAEAPIWRAFKKAEVAAVLVSHDKEPDLGEIELRAAFATVIPADASFNELRSAVRIGCSFAHKPHFKERAANVQAAAATYTARSVLVADDNRTNRNILTAILETAGHKVTQVCDGDEVLEILEKESFDILLLDVNMPRLNGIDACRMWRQIEGSRSHLPIVGVTADATSETEARCLGAGMDLRLTKPINSALLLATIDKYCGSEPASIELPDQLQDPLNIVVAIDTASKPSTGKTAIDAEHIAYLQSIGGSDFMAGMVDGFIEDSTESNATMARSIEERDPSLFRFAAHAFKSASNNIGALQLSALCGRLEKITEAEFNDKGRIHLAQVERELERAKAELDDVVPIEKRTGSL